MRNLAAITNLTILEVLHPATVPRRGGGAGWQAHLRAPKKGRAQAASTSAPAPFGAA
jgi:hypothetical protein